MISAQTAAIEAAIENHHVLEFQYVDRHGHHLVLQGEPYGFRTDHAGQHVLWIYNEAQGKYEDLVAARIESVRDTGRVFVKRPDWRTVLG